MSTNETKYFFLLFNCLSISNCNRLCWFVLLSSSSEINFLLLEERRSKKHFQCVIVKNNQIKNLFSSENIQRIEFYAVNIKYNLIRNPEFLYVDASIVMSWREKIAIKFNKDSIKFYNSSISITEPVNVVVHCMHSSFSVSSSFYLRIIRKIFCVRYALRENKIKKKWMKKLK